MALDLTNFATFQQNSASRSFLLGWLTFADHAQFTCGDHAEIAVLNQQTTVNAFEIEAGNASIPLAAGQYADVLLSRR
ncbi:Uncharacterised protein [Klebsiella pneumoniae]|uniref:Uncharacterized protein n=1 Tax=Klebsiella pneumoniae TaxID=573 RepID=A0A4P0XIP3_KLEPN|nr:Uncharacterised protein [Klebsiella pneumoniae]